MRYDLLLPPRVIFGWGRRVEIGTYAKSLGRRALIVLGSRTLERRGVLHELTQSLKAAGIDVCLAGRSHREPTVDDVDQMTAALLDLPIRAGDFVIGLGGGSALDLAKAVCAMTTNSQGRSVKDFLEGVGTGQKLDMPPLPLLAIPTTAGTGTEATRNAVISVDQPPCKKSLRHDALIPRVALVDPELMISNPREVTAASGMDALTQLIESYISCRAQPITRALCLEGLREAITALPVAVNHPDSREARETMAHAAFLSGVALANSGLGLAHGVAAALGVVCGTNHGLACAAMLPVALRVNQSACLLQLAQLSRAAMCSDSANDEIAAHSFIETIERLGRSLNIPRRLRDLGVQQEQIPLLAECSQGNSLSGNPVGLSVADVQSILQQHW